MAEGYRFKDLDATPGIDTWLGAAEHPTSEATKGKKIVYSTDQTMANADDMSIYTGLAVKTYADTVGAKAAQVGPSINFWLDDTVILASSTANAYPIKTLSKTPVATTEVIESTVVNNSTAVLATFLCNSALNISQINAGAWLESLYDYATVATANTQILANYFNVIAESATVTITGTGTSRTATASSGTPFSDGDDSPDITACSYIMTPTALLQITGYTSETVVTVACLDGYVNESAVAFTKFQKLFQIQTADINRTSLGIDWVSPYSASAYAINSNDKLAIMFFATTTDAENVTIYLSHNGSEHASYVTSPLVNVEEYSETQGVWRSNGGNDNNSGLNPETPVKLIGKALAVAASLGPVVSKPVAIFSMDGQVEGNINLPSYTHYFGPNTKISATSILANNTRLDFGEYYYSGGGVAFSFSGSSTDGNSYLTGKYINNGYIFADTSQGTNYVNVQSIDGDGTYSIRVKSGSTLYVKSQTITDPIVAEDGGTIYIEADTITATLTAGISASIYIVKAQSLTGNITATASGSLIDIYNVGTYSGTVTQTYGKVVYPRKPYNYNAPYQDVYRYPQVVISAGSTPTLIITGQNTSIAYTAGGGNVARIAGVGGTTGNYLLAYGYMSYETLNNLTFTQTGGIRIVRREKYTGFPASNLKLFEAGTSGYNYIKITHLTTGYIELVFADSAGNINTITSSSTFSADTTYSHDHLLTFDFTNGHQYYYLDGVRIATGTITMTRAALGNEFFHIGDQGVATQFYFREFVVYNNAPSSNPPEEYAINIAKGVVCATGIDLTNNATIGGLVKSNTGLQIPCPSGGTVTTLAQYEYVSSISMTFTGAWTEDLTVTGMLQTTGHDVTLTVPLLQGVGLGTTYTDAYSTAAVVPTRFRPASGSMIIASGWGGWSQDTNGGAKTQVLGYGYVGTDGVVYLYPVTSTTSGAWLYTIIGLKLHWTI